MDKNKWEEVKAELLYAYVGTVNLLIDGYDIRLVREPISELKNAIWVYVYGTDGVKLAISESDEAKEIERRFFCPKTKYLFNQKKLEKAPKKVKATIMAEKEKYTYRYFQPWWTSFNQMKKHLEKNNKSIELKGVGYACLPIHNQTEHGLAAE